MLKQTIRKLSITIFASTIASIILSFLIITTLGAIGSTSSISAASSSGATSSSSASGSSSSSSVSGSSSSGTSSVSGSSGSSKVSSASSSASSTAGIQFSDTKGGFYNMPSGKIILGIACVLILLALVYSAAWQEGNKDPNRINYGHMEKFMLKGLVAGLFASIPNAVLYILFVITQFASSGSVFATVIGALFRLYNIQYVVFGEAIIGIPVLAIVFLLPVPLFAEAGYLMGYRHITFIRRIIYKNTKKPAAKRKSTR